MKVGIYTNLHKDFDLSVTKRLIQSLSRFGVSYLLDEGLIGKIDGEYFSSTNNCQLDFMVTIGGDGTILRIAKFCALNHIPIVGINLGFTGFLAEEEPEKIDDLVSELLAGNYRTEKRAFLSAEINGKSFLALNDAVISRGYDARMLETDVIVNGEFVDRFFCDGYIVSTPTGSTAYSLSAGGAILSPSVSAFILTSINSHSLHSRPIVVSENDKIDLRISERSEANLVVDGEPVSAVNGGMTVSIRKAEVSAEFIKLKGHSFFKKLLTKLNKWSVTDKE